MANIVLLSDKKVSDEDIPLCTIQIFKFFFA